MLATPAAPSLQHAIRVRPEAARLIVSLGSFHSLDQGREPSRAGSHAGLITSSNLTGTSTGSSLGSRRAGCGPHRQRLGDNYRAGHFHRTKVPQLGRTRLLPESQLNNDTIDRRNIGSAGKRNCRSSMRGDYSVAPKMVSPRLRRLLHRPQHREAQRPLGQSRHQTLRQQHPLANWSEQ